MLELDPYAGLLFRDRIQLLIFEAELAHLLRSLIAAIWELSDRFPDMSWKPPEHADREVRAWMKARGWEVTQLVITDLRMPSMSGEEFAKKMAQLSSPPPLLYISGGDPPPGAESTKFLQKPFTREALLRAVRVVLKVDQ